VLGPCVASCFAYRLLCNLVLVCTSDIFCRGLSCLSHSCVLHARKEQDVTTALRRFQCAACAVFSQHLSSIATCRFGSQVGWVETLETLAILEETAQADRWSRLIKTDQDWSRLIKTDQDWSRCKLFVVLRIRCILTTSSCGSKVLDPGTRYDSFTIVTCQLQILIQRIKVAPVKDHHRWSQMVSLGALLLQQILSAPL